MTRHKCPPMLSPKQLFIAPFYFFLQAHDATFLYPHHPCCQVNNTPCSVILCPFLRLLSFSQCIYLVAIIVSHFIDDITSDTPCNPAQRQPNPVLQSHLTLTLIQDWVFIGFESVEYSWVEPVHMCLASLLEQFKKVSCHSPRRGEGRGWWIWTSQPQPHLTLTLTQRQLLTLIPFNPTPAFPPRQLFPCRIGWGSNPSWHSQNCNLTSMQLITLLVINGRKSTLARKWELAPISIHVLSGHVDIWCQDMRRDMWCQDMWQ